MIHKIPIEAFERDEKTQKFIGCGVDTQGGVKNSSYIGTHTIFT